MPQSNDLSRSLAALDQDSTLIAVIEMSQSSWLVAGIIPGVNRQPLKKLAVAETALLGLLHRWRDEATKAGRTVSRIVVAFEAGRDGFWLARWLRARGIEAHVIHATSVAVSREHRRAKTDRLDTELLKRAFLGWLRGERGHCSMAAIPTLEEEDAKRPNREREGLVGERTRIVNRIKSTWLVSGSRLQADLTPGAGAARSSAHTGGYAAAAEHTGRVAPRHGALALCYRSIEDRSRAPGTARGAPPTRRPCDGPAASTGHRRRRRTADMLATKSCRVTCATAEPGRVMPG